MFLLEPGQAVPPTAALVRIEQVVGVRAVQRESLSLDGEDGEFDHALLGTGRRQVDVHRRREIRGHGGAGVAEVESVFERPAPLPDAGIGRNTGTLERLEDFGMRLDAVLPCPKDSDPKRGIDGPHDRFQDWKSVEEGEYLCLESLRRIRV